jgi:hypothetical protein
MISSIIKTQVQKIWEYSVIYLRDKILISLPIPKDYYDRHSLFCFLLLLDNHKTQLNV